MKLELALKKGREEVIADYKASPEFQDLLDAEYDDNFPATFKDCWKTIIGKIGQKIPGVTLEEFPVSIASGAGPSKEIRESARDSSISPVRAASIEAVTSPLQDVPPAEDIPVIPASTTDTGADATGGITRMIFFRT